MPKETIASLKQQDQSLKQQVDALYKEVKSLKENLQPQRLLMKATVTNTSNVIRGRGRLC